MSYVILLLTVGVTIYALVDCWNTPDDEVRGLPRLAWLLVVLLFPLVGPGAYLIFGRDHRAAPQPGRPRVVAPDDDPDFLRQLDQQRRRAAADERRIEQQQRRERKERERKERHDRKRQGDPDGLGPEPPEGGDHSGRPTG